MIRALVRCWWSCAGSGAGGRSMLERLVRLLMRLCWSCGAVPSILRKPRCLSYTTTTSADLPSLGAVPNTANDHALP